MTECLSKLKNSKNLVSIRRQEIDGRRIQAFLLDYSDELILVQYVYDFNLDGLMVLRRSDISEIESSKTDILQTQILKDEGLYLKVDFNFKCDVSCWRGVLSTLNSLNRFIIAEDETSDCPMFYLGEIRDIREDSVSILCFSGAANWDDEVSVIYYKDISCVQSGSNYAKVYERCFERNSI